MPVKDEKFKRSWLSKSCGKHFCYVCGADWRTCDCPLWDENRLYNVPNRIVEDEVEPNANEIVRARVSEEVVDNLRHHEDVGCAHGRRSQWKYRDQRKQQCEVCYHRLPHYLFECKTCHLLACNNCIRNRLR